MYKKQSLTMWIKWWDKVSSMRGTVRWRVQNKKDSRVSLTIKKIGADGNMGLSEKLDPCHDGTRVSRARTWWVSVFHSSGHFCWSFWLKGKLTNENVSHRRVPRKAKKHKVLLCARNEGSGISNPEKRMSMETWWMWVTYLRRQDWTCPVLP